MRPNSWNKSRQKSPEFSSLLFTVSSTVLPWDFYFFKLKQPLTVSTVQLLYTVKKNGGKPYRKHHTPSLWLKKSMKKPQVWELSRLCPEPSMKLHIHEFGLWSCRYRAHTWQAITAVSPSSMRSGLWSSMLTRGKSMEKVITFYYAKFYYKLNFRIRESVPLITDPTLFSVAFTMLIKNKFFSTFSYFITNCRYIFIGQFEDYKLIRCYETVKFKIFLGFFACSCKDSDPDPYKYYGCRVRNTT